MITMAQYSLWITLLAVFGCAFCQSVSQSPCPEVFKYELQGSEAGKWYGVVTLMTDITLHGIWLNIVLDGKADILGNWIGDVTTSDNTDFKIENTTLKLHPDRPLAVRFFIQYNQYGKTPRISHIRLNGIEICSAVSPVYEFTIRPEDILSARDGVTTKGIGFRPTKEEVIPVRKPAREETRPVYAATDSGGGSVNPYSIIGGNGAQELGASEKKRPTLISSGTQTRPADRIDQTRPSYEQTKPSSAASRPSYDQSIPDTDIRPSYDQTRPASEASGTNSVIRPTSQVSRPGYDSLAPDSDVSRPTYDQRPAVTRRPAKRPEVQSTDFQDYSEDNGSASEGDYFTGGLPSIHTVLGSASKHPRPAVQTTYQEEQCGRPVQGATPLIVNGRQTAEGQWPWQIALYRTQTVDSKYICGGTLISRSHVVTAAHCVTLKSSAHLANKNTFTVYLGKHNLRTSVEGVQIRFIANIHVHPSYNASSYSSDAAILKLREPTEFTDHVRPACIWPEDQVDLSYIVGKRGAVVGWGFDEKGLPTEELHLVEMPVVDQETCIRSYSEFFARFTSQYTYCAGFRDGRSVCNGDSGGGMVFRIGESWHLRGLVSLSSARQNDTRCDTSHYVIFTDLAKFLRWLRQIVNDY